LRTAASLLTRIPVGDPPRRERDIARAVPWLPVVGGLVGIAVATSYAAVRMMLPPNLAAAIAVLTGVVITGALHEDGLADTVDAFEGGTNAQERLEILRDPRHGTYGVIAIVLSVGLRILAIGSMRSLPAIAVVPAVHALSRVAATGLLLPRSARGSGLGASYARAAGARRFLIAAFAGTSFAVVGLGIWTAGAIVIVGAVAWCVGAWSIRRIRGITGDVAGAAEQIAEVALLLYGVALVRGGYLAVPWWR
jgi:adenosylcobinamide-GDP ribazoletransferase